MEELPAELKDDALVWRQEMLEKLYNYSNEMMELALGEQPIPPDLIRKVLRETTVHMQLQPVLCGSALHGIGVQPVLDAVQYYLPSPLDVPPVEGESVGEKQKKMIRRGPSPSEPFCGLVFKVLPAKTGDIHWVRVYSGVLKSNSRALNPGKDVTIVQTGSTPERLAALEARRVSGSALVPPATFIAQKKGFHVLADVAALGLAYQHQGGVTTRRYLRENPTVVRNFVKSYIEAVHRLKTDRAMGLKTAAKYLRLEDQELLQKTYESSIDENKLPAKQYPTVDGLKIIIDQLALTNPKAKTVKPQDFIDARFVEEFDKSGYIDSLYGRKK
jgi:hypothetical protein